jgi:type IV secretion system protein VirB3
MEDRRGSLIAQPVFVALTKPQMIAGVTFTFCILNMITSTILFINLQTFWVLLGSAIAHVVGYVACLKEPRRFDLWLTAFRRASRLKNFSLWKSNSYRP